MRTVPRAHRIAEADGNLLNEDVTAKKENPEKGGRPKKLKDPVVVTMRMERALLTELKARKNEWNLESVPDVIQKLADEHKP